MLQPELEDLFIREEAWDKINSGEWTSTPGYIEDSKTFFGCLNEYVRHYDPSGHHRATTHRIYDPATDVERHRHGKDIIINGVKYRSISKW
ncbi:MAG: hypothetical protein O3C10_11655 [Chloroflexi bacterium]|nr:hypothetical protein [Chloroflexota bacterium]